MARRRVFQPVTELELEVLTNLWDVGELTIRQLTDAIYEDGSDSQYATIQKILDRLQQKKYVVRIRTHHAHRFRAIIQKEAFMRDKLQAMADDLCNGSLKPIFSCLVDAKSFSSKDLRSLRELVGELEKRQGCQKRKVSKRGRP